MLIQLFKKYFQNIFSSKKGYILNFKNTVDFCKPQGQPNPNLITQ